MGGMNVVGKPASLLLLSLLLSLILTSACTRREESKQVSIRIAVPHRISKNLKPNGALTVSSADLAHLIINVSGQGIPSPITFTWDSHPPCGTCTAPAPPSSFPVAAPKGSGRIVQVLAVYQTEAGTGSFYYGDATKDIINEQESVEISIAEIGGGLSLASGVVAGRMLDQSGVGPTGRVAVKYEPSGKPAMVLEYTEIFAGWFSFFGLKEIPLRYELADGTMLFGGPMALNTIAASAQVLKVTIPQNFRHEQYTMDGPVNFRLEQGEELFLGYFGPGGASKKVCYNGGTAYTFTRRSLASATPFDFLVFPGTGTNNLTPAGGDSALANCTGTQWIDFMRFLPAIIDNNGTHSASGFSGLLTFVPGQPLISAQHSAGSLNLNWTYLPDVAAQVQGMRLYRIPHTERQAYRADHDGISCLKLASLTHLGEAPSPQQSLSVPFPAADVPSSLFVLCPFTANGNLARGYETGVYGGNGTPPTQLKITKFSTPQSAIAQDQCTELRVQLVDDNNSPRSYQSPIPFGINAGLSAATIYSNATTCSSQTSPITAQNLTLPANQSDFVFYYRTSASPSSTLSLSTVYNSAFLTLTTNSVSLNVHAVGDKYFAVQGPGRIVRDTCYSYRVEHRDFSGTYVNTGSNQTVTLSAPLGAEFFSSATCSGGPITSTTFWAGTNIFYFYVKLSSTAAFTAPVPLTVSLTGVVPGVINIEQSLGSATPTQLAISGGPEFRTGYCEPVQIMTLNSDQALVKPTSDISINLANTGFAGSYHNDSNCSSVAVNTVIHTTSSELTNIYYRTNLIQGSGQLTGTAVGLSTGILNAQVRGPQYLTLSVSPTSVTPGTCVHATVSTRDAYNSLFTHAVDFPLSLAGFPVSASPVYSDANCTLVTPVKVSANSSSTFFYFIADNPTASSAAFSALAVVATGAGPSPGQSLTIAARPVMSLSSGTFKTATGIDLFLNYLLTPFTGVPTFSYSHFSGSNAGGLNSGTGIFNPASAGSDVITFTDSNAATSNIAINSFASVLDLDFTSGTLPAGLTFTRSGPATYFNASGTMTTATTNSPRFEYNPDPISGHPILGLLIEPAATNVATYSEQIESWTSSFATTSANVVGVTAPNGTTTAERVSWNNPTSGNMASMQKPLFSWSFNTDYTASVFVKKDTSRFAGMKIHESGTSYSCSGIVIDLDTGDAVRMADPWPCSTSNDFGVQKLTNGWYRIWVRYRSLAGPSTGYIYLYPVYHGGTVLSPTRDNSVPGNTFFWGAQVESGLTMSSYIATTTASASRVADIVQKSTGTSIVTNAIGTFYFEWNQPPATKGPSALFAMGGTVSDSHQLLRTASGDFGLTVMSAGTVVASNLGMIPQPGINKLSYAYNSTGGSLINFANNSKPMPPFASAFVAPSISSTAIKIGGTFSGVEPLRGHMRRLTFWSQDLSLEGLRSMTKTPP
jgi:hypothetical protein